MTPETTRRKGKVISYNEYAESCDVYEDYLAWKEKFKTLGLSNTSFEEDVMEKLENQEAGRAPYD